MSLTNKICPDCGTDKDIAEFEKSGRTADGFQSKCKDCSNRFDQTAILMLRKKEALHHALHDQRRAE